MAGRALPEVLDQVSRIWQTERTKVEGNIDALRRRCAGLARPAAGPPLAPALREQTARRAGPGVRHHPRRARRGAQVPAGAGPRPGLAACARDRRRGRPPRGPAHARSTSARAASTTTSAAASPATPSTRFWLVPHFEKMLYDNAQLLALLADAYADTQNPLFRARAAETVGLARARDAGRGRLRLQPRCRQRGRGGPILRLGCGRDRPAAGSRRGRLPACLRRHRRRQLGRQARS